MCGIFGTSGKYATTHNTDKFLKNCAIAGAVRGVDSTGMIFLQDTKEDKVTYLKRAVNGTTFVEDVFNPVFHMGNKVHSLIGHNRAATVGSVNDSTAHPFIEGPIIGVHNGTLSGDWRSDLQVSRKCDVDSRGLYRAVAARGIDWVVSNLYGAAALVWVDCSTQQQFVYRNSDRPLHYAVNAGETSVWYASEKGMLEWLGAKSGLTFYGEIREFKVNTLYEITNGEVKELRTLPRATRAVTSPPPRGATSAPTTKATQKKRPHGSSTTANSTATTNQRILPRGKGLRWQKGVAFRGEAVTEDERSEGIVGEYAEVGFATYECFCCGNPIETTTFMESTTDIEVKMHESCFDLYRSEYSADDPVIIIRRNEKLRRTA